MRYSLTSRELDERLAVAKSAPGVAHLILGGPSPTCDLCGGTMAPIIDGRHLSPKRFCEPSPRTIPSTPRHA